MTWVVRAHLPQPAAPSLPGPAQWVPRRVVWVLVAIAVLKIAAFVGASHLGYIHPFLGGNARGHYLPAAERLATEHRFNGPDSRPDSKVSPGYPLYLAVIQVTVGERLLTHVAVTGQLVMDLGVALILCAVGCRFANWKAGLLAGMGWSLFPPAVVISTWITAEPLFTLLLTAAVALTAVHLGRHGWLWPTAAGALLGAATLVRATTILLPAFLAPFWLFAPGERRVSRPIGFLVAFIAMVGPWSLRNLAVLDDPIPVSVGFGSVFLQGSDERLFTIAGKQTHYPRLYEARRRTGAPIPAPGARESLHDRLMFEMGLANYRERWRDRPESFPVFAIRKVARMWYGTESGAIKAQLLLGACSVVVVPIAVLGLWRLRRAPFARVFLVTIGYFVLLTAVTLPQFRYVEPIFPLLILLVATWMGERLASGRRPGKASPDTVP
jgi:hypothetical protein